ncbi:hypothetical protein DYE49_09820 [Treponema rectale]|uniref:Ig-like domain-containing protein n=1 Tax=Treponema rectale TaxID=744512 RepID=A0A840SF68_9SPIR|nr:bacterial Ig-like domain-containing protein [Treponema rectale]MBB5219390.1 hypothetical protein [Treponema rectale]QOS40730.1 hypothetical protein DYE49_09820 [Treponema rectale]
MKKLSWLAAVSALLIGSSVFVSCGGSDSDGGSDPVLDKITVDASAAKTVFAVGDYFSADGLDVKAVMSDKTKKPLSVDEYTVALAAANLGENGKIIRAKESGHSEEAVVTVTYEEKTATYNVTVSDVVTKLELTIGSAAKAEYDVGEEFDPTDITVKAFYGDADTVGEDVTESATFTATVKDDEGNDVEFTTEEPGTFAVTLTAEYAGKTAYKKATVTVKEPAAPADYEISFSNTKNSYVYSGDGVYTLTIVEANDSEWGNQIFIKNPNKLAGVAKGDLVLATITVKSDKAINELFFKNQYNGGTYSGVDTAKALTADTETVFQVVGTAANDYDDSSSYVIALRGNLADTTLVISNIKSEVLTDYDVTSVTLEATPDSISAGETSTITLKDQYGIAIADAVYEITSADPVATLEGNVLTAGDTAETVTVKATYGDFEATVDVVISAEKDYAKYWAPSITTEGNNAPADYFSIWANLGWVDGGYVHLSDMTASATGVALTQTVDNFCWFGTQIWYGVSAASDFSFKVTSTVAGGITINDVVYELEAGTAKEITLEGVTGKLAIQLGTKEPATQLGDCTFTISDFSVTAAE